MGSCTCITDCNVFCWIPYYFLGIVLPAQKIVALASIKQADGRSLSEVKKEKELARDVEVRIGSTVGITRKTS